MNTNNRRKSIYNMFFVFFVLVTLLSLVNTQGTIFPDNYLATDTYFKDDITTPSEAYRFINFALRFGITGYRDEYSGIYYSPSQVI
jgi:hypothetical protein